MTSLFIDTSYDQILGLLNEKKSWMEFKKFEGQKLTGVIHKDLNQILTNHSIDPLQLTSIIYSAGPGFYTGLRVSFGIADIFRLQNIPIFSFYSHLIPSFCGIKDYLWITKAYRGEIFIYDSVSNEIKLYLEKNYLNEEMNRRAFTHSETAVDENLKTLFPSLEFTQDLLKDRPDKIFENVQREDQLYYFRPLDEEYKPSL